MITSGLTECVICWSSCIIKLYYRLAVTHIVYRSLFLQDWKFMFTMRRGLLKALGHMVCRVLLGGFGVDVCSGCKGLLMVSGEDELLSNELNELDRSTGVVLNREEEKLGMPHWQHIQDILLLSARI